MRQIRMSAIMAFLGLSILAGLFGVALCFVLCFWFLSEGFWFIGFVFSLCIWFLLAVLLGRAVASPGALRDGEITPGTKEEFLWQLHLLTLLFYVNCFIRSSFLPVPFQRLVYQLAGAKWGKNTFCSGVILDPPHVFLGANTILGQGSVTYAHVIEGDHLEIWRVRIGDHVTVGAHAIVMPGVQIGSGAIVASGSVVKKGTVVPAGEVWGGVPAKRLRGVDSGSD